MREKWWDSIPSQPFTANGGSEGQVTIADAVDFKVKQRVIIKATAQLDIQVEVKRVLSDTSLVVGPSGSNIDTFSNLTAYTTAASATIHADAQTRPAINEKDIIRAVFAEEPANAVRTLPVDQLGTPISKDNPAPVKGIQLLDKNYDTGSLDLPSATQEVYTTFIGGLAGTPVQRITINYVDSSKNVLLNWQRENWNGSIWVIS